MRGATVSPGEAGTVGRCDGALPGPLEEAELGLRMEPMVPPLRPLGGPLDEEDEEDLPPSTESSSSKFLSVGDTNKQTRAHG